MDSMQAEQIELGRTTPLSLVRPSAPRIAIEATLAGLLAGFVLAANDNTYQGPGVDNLIAVGLLTAGMVAAVRRVMRARRAGTEVKHLWAEAALIGGALFLAWGGPWDVGPEDRALMIIGACAMTAGLLALRNRRDGISSAIVAPAATSETMPATLATAASNQPAPYVGTVSTWRCNRCQRINHQVLACPCGHALGDAAPQASPSSRLSGASSSARTLSYAIAGLVLATASVLPSATGLNDVYDPLLEEAVQALMLLPMEVIIPSLFILALSRFVTGLSLSYWTAYKGTLVAFLLAFLVWLFVMSLGARAGWEVVVSLIVALPLMLTGIAWVFGSLFKNADGQPVGLKTGGKIMGVWATVVAVLIGVASLAFARMLPLPQDRIAEPVVQSTAPYQPLDVAKAELVQEPVEAVRPCPSFMPRSRTNTYDLLLSNLREERCAPRPEPITADASAIYKQYEENPIQATQTYLARYVRLSGRIQSIELDYTLRIQDAPGDVPLFPAVRAGFEGERREALQALKVGQHIDIAGWVDSLHPVVGLVLRNAEVVGAGPTMPAR